RYETTVGAALPVLHALEGLRLSGDPLRRLTAVLSGSLSFVCSRVSEGVALSAAVREACELGYCEPHPGVDLGAEGVARKLVILLREGGVPVERPQVAVEPLVPGCERLGRAELLAGLAGLDPSWRRRAAAARRRGARLVP